MADTGVVACPSAYEFTGSSFNHEGASAISETFHFDVDSFVVGGSVVTGGVAASEGQILDVFTDAAAAWGDLGAEVGITNLDLAYESDDRHSLGDGVFEVFFYTGTVEDYSGTYSADAAKTWYNADGTDNDDCDTVVFSEWEDEHGNRTDIEWGLDATLASTEYSLLHALIHELGHCLGLSHNTDPPVTSAMYRDIYLGIPFTGFSTDDHDALLCVYGPG